MNDILAPKRIFAFLVDVIIYVALWIFFYFNLHFGDYLSWLLASVYILMKDGMINGQSFGKLLMKLQVVNMDNQQPILITTSIQRNAILVFPNLIRFIPFLGILLLIVIYGWELYLIYTQENGIRWGDQFARSQVIQS